MDSALRELVWRRAAGRCEYCHLPQEYDSQTLCIEHIIARKHRGPTVAENLALACFYCNSFKGTDIASIDPLTGNVVRLFHPREDDWQAHFAWNGAVLVGRTDVGRVTVLTLNVNADDRLFMRECLLAEGIRF